MRDEGSENYNGYTNRETWLAKLWMDSNGACAGHNDHVG
jgi:hypothetical protein